MTVLLENLISVDNVAETPLERWGLGLNAPVAPPPRRRPWYSVAILCGLKGNTDLPLHIIIVQCVENINHPPLYIEQ